MTGRYEQALINLAEGGAPFDVPATRDLIDKLSSLRKVVSGAADLPGIEGEAAQAAKARFDAAAETIGQQIAYLEGTLDDALGQANGLRDAAREKLSALPAGSLSGGQETVVRSAAVGTTLFLGPISLLAGEGAVQAFNGYLAQQREEQARGDFTTISETLNGMSPPAPPAAALSSDGGRSVELEDDSADTGTSDPGQRSLGGGDRNQNQSAPVPRGPAPVEGDLIPAPPQPHLIPTPDAPRGPGIDLGRVPPHYTSPTPDGAISGIGTLPGHVPDPGTIGGSFPGGISGGGAGLGSGLSAGLIAGGGGAAALSRLSSGMGSSAAPAGRNISGSGGLLGKGGTGGSSPGLGGRSGTAPAGGAAGTSGANGAANGTAAGNRGTGSSAGAGGAGGAAGGAGGGRGAGGMGSGSGSGSGSRSDRRDERRGLGGPIAPRLEDDEEIAPRSENAAAGARDD